MRTAFFVLAFAVLGGCSLFPPHGGADGTVLFSGTSFGECGGYCVMELTIDGRAATLVHSSWNDPDFPSIRHRRTLSIAERMRLDRAFDRRALRRADEVYGCPDCADGGAEWVGATWDDGEKRVMFEYGDEVGGLDAYIEAMRGLRGTFPGPPQP